MVSRAGLRDQRCRLRGVLGGRGVAVRVAVLVAVLRGVAVAVDVIEIALRIVDAGAYPLAIPRRPRGALLHDRQVVLDRGAVVGAAAGAAIQEYRREARAAATTQRATPYTRRPSSMPKTRHSPEKTVQGMVLPSGDAAVMAVLYARARPGI
jgi:hypothetical protein